MGNVRPVLKWAGGKSQLIPNLEGKMPANYNRYFEPFFGGGALFFHLKPQLSVISDSNEELIVLYQTLVSKVEEVIELLKSYPNDKDFFYSMREMDREEKRLSDVERSARTVYLNKTCFNGLYRVNRKGEFNTPFGNYKNPTICDEENLREASKMLNQAQIICGDYSDVLLKNAKKDDFIFLDPPYIPISENSDFKRYTKEQFGIEDHHKLKQVVNELHERECFIILTNSNHPTVIEQYKEYQIEIVKTKRNINCKGELRSGEDIIVTIPPSL